jgi:hypothetical protein
MRQQRDKGLPPPTDDDLHRNIPRDAEGNPIFLILPPTLRARYEEGMAECEAAWRGGEPLAVAEASTWAWLHRQPHPAWLEQATIDVIVGRRSKSQAKRYLENQIRMARYQKVRALKVGWAGARCGTAPDGREVRTLVKPAESITWDEAYARASELLEGTMAAGSAATMKADYSRVQRDLNAGRYYKYFELKDRRYRQNGQPEPSESQDS